MQHSFTVQIDRLAEARDNLERNKRRIAANADELRAVRRRLMNLTGMEKCVAKLSRSLRDIDEELADLHQMIRALERIMEMYRNTERRISDKCEGALITVWPWYHPYHPWKHMLLRNVGDELKKDKLF